MNRIVFILTLSLIVVNSYGQLTCGSELNLMDLQQTDSVRYQRIIQYEAQMQSRIQRQSLSSDMTIIIPVVVHIVYKTSEQNITNEVINSQIDVLNQDYNRTNPDATNTPAAFATFAASANFEFKLAKIDPNGNPTSGITRTQTSVNGFSADMDDVKSTLSGGHDAWNTQRYLNIWVCNFTSSSLCGYAQFPDELYIKPETDGVVISWKCFGVKANNIDGYRKGRTTTHEVGHWLNLRHIWGDAPDCSVSDFVDDTPNQYNLNFYCPSFPLLDNCTPTIPGVMFMNYMDYTSDDCKNLFTQGQVARMRAIFDSEDGYRRGLLLTAEYLTTPPIIGDNTICDSQVFNIPNLPPDASVSWSVTGPFSLSASGAQVNVSKASLSSGSGVLSAEISVNGHTQTVTKNITSCSPSLSGADIVCDNERFTVNGLPQGANVQWSVTNGFVMRAPLKTLKKNVRF